MSTLTPTHTQTPRPWNGVEVFEPTLPAQVVALVIVRSIDSSGEPLRSSGPHQRIAKALSELPSTVVSGYARSLAEAVIILPNRGDHLTTVDPAYDAIFAAADSTHPGGTFDVEILTDQSRFDFAANPLIEIEARARLMGHQHPEGREVCECMFRGLKYPEKRRMSLGAYAGPLY